MSVACARCGRVQVPGRAEDLPVCFQCDEEIADEMKVETSEPKQYARRDIMALDKAGGHYCRHVSAMTSEGLHSKSAIAAELAWRDAEIERVKAERDATIRDVRSTDATTQELFRELEQRAETAEAILAHVRTVPDALRKAGLLQQATAIEDALAEAERRVANG